MDSVQEIIGGHDRSYTSLSDSFLKCRKIYFMESPFIDIGRYAVPGIFLIVPCKMLDAGHHTLTLDTGYVVGSYLTCEIRILSKVLEITSA